MRPGTKRPARDRPARPTLPTARGGSGDRTTRASPPPHPAAGQQAVERPHHAEARARHDRADVGAKGPGDVVAAVGGPDDGVAALVGGARLTGTACEEEEE